MGLEKTSAEEEQLALSGVLDGIWGDPAPVSGAQPIVVTVTVVDTNPPVVTAPADIRVEAKSPTGTPATNPAIAAFLTGASAVDDEDGVPVTTKAPSVFPLGPTVVTFSATDSAGNAGTAQTTVAVVDTTPPDVTAPANITVEAEGPLGTPASNPAIAAFLAGASANDIVDGVIAVTNN